MNARLSTKGTWWFREGGVVLYGLTALVGALAASAIVTSADRRVWAGAASFLFIVVGAYGAYRANRLADVWLEGRFLRIRRRWREWQVPLSRVVLVRQERWWIWLWMWPCIIVDLRDVPVPSAIYFTPALLRDLCGQTSVLQDLQAAVAVARMFRSRPVPNPRMQPTGHRGVGIRSGGALHERDKRKRRFVRARARWPAADAHFR
jgi:hypothetical protein